VTCTLYILKFVKLSFRIENLKLKKYIPKIELKNKKYNNFGIKKFIIKNQKIKFKNLYKKRILK